MTRGMFFRVMAALGLGQAIKRPDGSDCKSSDLVVGSSSGVVCLEPGHGEPPCKEGENRCPLGHCQKPRNVWVGEYTQMLPSNKEWPIAFEQHVCSTCGIVYVQQVEEPAAEKRQD